MQLVVAQMAEKSLLVPRVQGSNSLISKIYNEHEFMLTVGKTKIKKKEAEYYPLKTNQLQVVVAQLAERSLLVSREPFEYKSPRFEFTHHQIH